MYSSLDTVWVLLCTALIFFMQAGFAMLETGFTRAKNAGNIIMKNLMDYCIGSVLFWVIGFSFLYGDSIGGFIGTPSLFAAGKFAAAGDLPKRVFLMFATVFCSTATTIVSGAMAGRTKFKAYLTYSAVMSGIVYPITGHWIWNSAGWLKSIGFQTGAGFMVGSPYQTAENLADDLLFLQKLKPQMCGIGPFIPHKDTDFRGFAQGGLDLTLTLLSVIRLMHPHILLPATTALGTIHPEGRELGILHGANVVMPNLSPVEHRKDYAIYDNKICTGDESAACIRCLSLRMQHIGYQIVTDRGDYK